MFDRRHAPEPYPGAQAAVCAGWDLQDVCDPRLALSEPGVELVFLQHHDPGPDVGSVVDDPAAIGETERADMAPAVFRQPVPPVFAGMIHEHEVPDEDFRHLLESLG